MRYEHVIFQPCSNADSRQHFYDTVEQTVDLHGKETFFSADDFSRLMRIYPDGRARLWGITNGKKKANWKSWSRIRPGDTVLFCWQSYFHYKAIVKFVTKNPALARLIWGEDPDGCTWENIYFIDGLEECCIPYAEINALCGYREKAYPRGFRVLDENKSAAILYQYDFAYDYDVIGRQLQELAVGGEDPYEVALKALYDTDRPRIVKVRKEQGILRDSLFRGKKTAVCGICGKKYPVGMLETAHIKLRSKCTKEERCNRHVVMPMCHFGCNKLYELKYIKVEDAKITLNRKKLLTKDAEDYLRPILGKTCPYWSEKTKDFFEYHNKD